MKNYVDLETYGIQFKNLLSGPAPVGRILNYIIFAGESSMKYQPGLRNLHMEDNVGDAWCIEFMIGLGLVKISNKIPNTNTYSLKLTSKGTKMYSILYENALTPDFDTDSLEKVLEHLKNNGALNIIHTLEEIFRNSPVFLNLCTYLDINTSDEEYIEIKSSDFKDNFFGEMKSYYEHEEYIRNGNGTATTGSNRVPSLIQLLEFLNYSKVKNHVIYFNVKSFKEGIFNPDYMLDLSDSHFISEIEKENALIERLKEQFGIDGTRIVIEEVRLTQVQLIFKERLKKEYGKKCFLCGIENDELLVASHIKPAYMCNIHAKSDNNNGLLLCAGHDKLFDRNLISFQFNNGKIMISNKLSDNDKRLCNINEEMELEPVLMTPERTEYLMWHNEEFYKKESN